MRVNQVGYASGASKRAYLMASVDEAGATFTVTRVGGQPVLSGPIGVLLGSWSATFSRVYAIDLTSVSATGTYRITVDGPVDARSPSFEIGPGGRVYNQALSNALSFYENQRDGRHFIPSALRTAPGHLNDERAMTYRTPETTGSGHFSGDLSPARRPGRRLGWVVGCGRLSEVGADDELHGATCFSPAYGTSRPRWGRRAGGSDFTAEARFGTRWLLRMWDDSTRTLYYQVGIGNGNRKTVADHDIWRLPQADDGYGGRDPAFRYIRHRPVFRAGPARLADKPQPRRPRRRRDGAVLPGGADDPPEAREALPRVGRAHLRPGGYLSGPAPDADPVRLLPRARMA